MPIEVLVDSYSGYKTNERPRQFTLNEDTFDVEEIEEQWRSPDEMFFKVRTTGGKRYVLRYDERADKWTLLSDSDGGELLSRNPRCSEQ